MNDTQQHNFEERLVFARCRIAAVENRKECQSYTVSLIQKGLTLLGYGQDMKLLRLLDWAEKGREMWYKFINAFNKKNIIGCIAVSAGCVTIMSFVLHEMRRPEEMKRGKTQIEHITTAISGAAEAAREANANESARTQDQKITTSSSETKAAVQQMWSASVRVHGAKNVIKFVASSGNEDVPLMIGGTKTNKVVPIPENCQLTIQVSGARNQILIDDKLRSHVSVSGEGAGCSVSWENFSK